MSVARFNAKLNALLSKNSIENDDFLVFLKTLYALSNGIQDVKKLPAYAPVVQEWIGAFQNIFGKHKIKEDVKRYMNRLSTTVTVVYLKILQSLHQYERDYTQQFYVHWKQIISVMKASKRASSFIRNMDQFKLTVTHLRTAELRCEQLAILKVLYLYIERVPQSELIKFKVHLIDDSAGIIDGLIQLRQQPSPIQEHAFLHHINSMGDCISSFQPTKITCAYLALEYTKPAFEMWIDFNLKDKSIMFVAQPLTNDGHQSIAIVSNPKLKESLLNGEQLIIVKGLWSIFTVPEVSQLGQNFSVTILFPVHVRNMILESQVRNVFKIETNPNSSCVESSSKDFHSKQMNSKWRNNRNNLLPLLTCYDEERISEAPSGRSLLAGSVESSILLISSDKSVMDWKKSSCERLSSEGQQNRELLQRGTAFDKDIKDTEMKSKIVEEDATSSTNQCRKKDTEIMKDPLVIPQDLGDDYHSSNMSLRTVQEAYTNDKFENFIKRDHFDSGIDHLVFDLGKNEYIKNTLSKEKLMEENAESLTCKSRKEDNQITTDPLHRALDDDYQSSGLSFCDNMSHEEYTDDDIDDVHINSLPGKDSLVSDNGCKLPQNPLNEPVFLVPLRNHNENITVSDIPKALHQLRADYDSPKSFSDNESVKEAYTYNEFENLIQHDHCASDVEHTNYMVEQSKDGFNKFIADKEQILIPTPQSGVYYATIKTSDRSSSNARNESNLKPAENSLNDTNQLLQIDNDRYLQPLLSVAADDLFTVDDNNFVSSNLVKNNDRNQTAITDSSLLIPPPLIYQTDVSLPRDTFPSRHASDTQMVQNTVPETPTKTVEYEFASEELFQKTSRFYIDNGGLDYLNSTNFKRLGRREQKNKEQQLRTIHDMMNRGLEALHSNRNDKPSDEDPYALPSSVRPTSKRKSNSKKVSETKLNSYCWLTPSLSISKLKSARKKIVFEFPKQKRGKSAETKKAMTTAPRRIRNISLLFDDIEHETAPQSKKPKNVMKAPKYEVNINTSNKRKNASTPQPSFTVNNELTNKSADVGKENAKSSAPNYCAKKPKIEILSNVDLGVLHQSRSTEIMNQQVFCNVPSCNVLFNNLNKFTLLIGACKQHEHQLVQLAKSLQTIYPRVDAVNTD